MRIGLLLIGHGTRNLAGQEQMRQVHRQFAELMAPSPTQVAFLELAEPTIEQAMWRLAQQHVTHCLAVPALLFAAGHALQDIPAELERAGRVSQIDLVGQTTPLETSSAVLELSALRFRQTVCLPLQSELSDSQQCLNSCQNSFCPGIALAMIGRGSRSDEATEKMRVFARLRQRLTPVSQCEVGFVFAQSPSVPEVLQKIAASPHQTLVVQPHLLFEGELIEQLRKQVEDRQQEDPHRRWLITPTLGTDIALAQTLARLARQMFREIGLAGAIGGIV